MVYSPRSSLRKFLGNMHDALVPAAFLSRISIIGDVLVDEMDALGQDGELTDLLSCIQRNSAIRSARRPWGVELFVGNLGK